MIREDSELSQNAEPNESLSVPFPSPSASPEHRTDDLFDSYRLVREEDISSSFQNQTEENDSANNISSTITGDPNLTEFASLLLQETRKPLSDIASASDPEGTS